VVLPQPVSVARLLNGVSTPAERREARVYNVSNSQGVVIGDDNKLDMG